MKIVLYNSSENKYFAGITVSEGKHNCVVTTNRENLAAVFSKKKEAKEKQEFLKNSGYSFDVVELK